MAVRVAPILRALQHVFQLGLGGTHRDLAHLFHTYIFQTGSSAQRVWTRNGSHLQLRSAPHPLVDGPVLAAVDRLLDVELPHGRAGVEVVVVEHAVDGDVLAGPHHHLLRDVADGCGATPVTHSSQTLSIQRQILFKDFKSLTHAVFDSLWGNASFLPENWVASASMSNGSTEEGMESFQKPHDSTVSCGFALVNYTTTRNEIQPISCCVVTIHDRLNYSLMLQRKHCKHTCVYSPELSYSIKWILFRF